MDKEKALKFYEQSLTRFSISNQNIYNNPYHEAAKVAVECIEKQIKLENLLEQQKCHDIRKNPEDLPKEKVEDINLSNGFLHTIGELLEECEKNDTDNLELNIEIGDKLLSIDITFSISEVEQMWKVYQNSLLL